MPKKQKVRFHKGDRKPRSDKEYGDLSYKVKMRKRGRKILWQVLEQPTKNTIAEYFFEEILSATDSNFAEGRVPLPASTRVFSVIIL